MRRFLGWLGCRSALWQHISLLLLKSIFYEKDSKSKCPLAAHITPTWLCLQWLSASMGRSALWQHISLLRLGVVTPQPLCNCRSALWQHISLLHYWRISGFVRSLSKCPLAAHITPTFINTLAMYTTLSKCPLAAHITPTFVLFAAATNEMSKCPLAAHITPTRWEKY